MPGLIGRVLCRRHIFVFSLFLLFAGSLPVLGAGPELENPSGPGEGEVSDDAEGARAGEALFGVDSVIQWAFLSYDYVNLEFDHKLTLMGLHATYTPPVVVNERPLLYPQASVEALAVSANRYRTGNAGYHPVNTNGVVPGGKMNLSVGIGAGLDSDPVSVQGYLGPAFDWLAFIRTDLSVSAARGYRGVGGAGRVFASLAVSDSVSLSAGMAAAWYPIGWMPGENTSFSHAAATSVSLGLRFR